MKIYKFITQILLQAVCLLELQCYKDAMDNSLNDPLGKVWKKNLDEMEFAANAFFLTLCDYAYPIATENIYKYQ